MQIFRLLLLAALAALPLLLHSQTSTLHGRVRDQQSETPLIGATVQILNLEPVIGAMSDADGFFTLKNVPVGRQTLRIT
ncbi:MAG: carboxypeptidase-like regulatory domain-containing protein, partial [Saprospiraceae bacterium]|nr:carboxypeptidase-like regulatory domain-containing protein [Saprospiraceae bacterium]